MFAAPLCALLAGVPFAQSGAQASTVLPPPGQRGSCDGAMVTAVEIRVHPPSYNGMGAKAYETMGVVGLRHVTTRANVVLAYLHVQVGVPCTERDRLESERLLRAQPFLSTAAVRTVPDGDGRVRVLVDVVDEIPIVLGASSSRGTLASLALGSQNISGLGLGVVLDWSKGFAYRDGFGVRAIQSGEFGGPQYVALTAEQKPLGESLMLEVARPFLTDLQRHAFHLGSGESSDYYGLVRPAGGDVARYVRRTYYDAGYVQRIGSRDPSRILGLVGAVVLGEDVRVGDSTKVVSDSGLFNRPDSAFLTRYPAFAVTRVALIAGVRSLSFSTVSGFDALRAEQDVGIGVQLDVLAGPSIWASRGARDVFFAGDLYAGVGGAESFFSARLLAEAHRNQDTRDWEGAVGSARFAWYGKPSDRRTRLVSLEVSGIQHLAFPTQLTFRDADGGLPGFQDATAAGGLRGVVRIEERKLISLFPTRIDFAIAGFVDAGKIWAGDVPFGTTSVVRSSVGFSLLGGYPAGGKRTNRVDFAVPINPESGRARFELRFSSYDHTRLLWIEPRDVAGARTGAVPANLMKW